MTRLRSVPTAGYRAIPAELGHPPAAGPADEVTLVRLRRLVIRFFGEFPTVDRHLELLDARGAWYAEAALGTWTPDGQDTFFGLVRHVVRTQLAGPPPLPDIEGWLAAGVPSDPLLQERWRYAHALRWSLPRREPATTSRVVSTPTIEATDAVVADWPEEHWERFVLAYVKLENVLERRSITLPPVSH